MLNVSKLSSLLALPLIAGAVLGSPRLASATGGDYGAGNGGDGLELTPPSTQQDIEIPLPPDLNASGTLHVTGARTQYMLAVIPCQADAQGRPLRWSCGTLGDLRDSITQPTPGETYLNRDITLKPGLYALIYGYSQIFVRIEASQRTELKLSKMSIQKSDRPISASVFADITDPRSLESVLNLNFSASQSKVAAESFCKNPQGLNVKVCSDWFAAKTPTDLMGNVFLLGNSGKLLSWNFIQQKYFEEFPGAEPIPAGGFVSVFPGTYGIEFKDNETGETRLQFGIKVE